MGSLEKYLKNAQRGEFHWQCDETTDGIGMGGVLVESVSLKGRTATITKEGNNEFEVDVILNHEIMYDGEKTYEVIDYRSNREYARRLAERLVRKDIEIDEVKPC